MVESGVASTAYSLENTPDCKTLLARFCSRNAHLGRPTYTVIEELRMKRVFYRCRVDMASQSFTSRSYHTKKKDAEQDAAFEMVKCLCPQYLSEKEKLRMLC
jgi:dsRNA-specific ribonuclease